MPPLDIGFPTVTDSVAFPMAPLPVFSGASSFPPFGILHSPEEPNIDTCEGLTWGDPLNLLDLQAWAAPDCPTAPATLVQLDGVASQSPVQGLRPSYQGIVEKAVQRARETLPETLPETLLETLTWLQKVRKYDVDQMEKVADALVVEQLAELADTLMEELPKIGLRLASLPEDVFELIMRMLTTCGCCADPCSAYTQMDSLFPARHRRLAPGVPVGGIYPWFPLIRSSKLLASALYSSAGLWRHLDFTWCEPKTNLSDLQLEALLLNIKAKVVTRTITLSHKLGAEDFTGEGLSPLRASPVLEKIDLRLRFHLHDKSVPKLNGPPVAGILATMMTNKLETVLYNRSDMTNPEYMDMVRAGLHAAQELPMSPLDAVINWIEPEPLRCLDCNETACCEDHRDDWLDCSMCATIHCGCQDDAWTPQCSKCGDRFCENCAWTDGNVDSCAVCQEAFCHACNWSSRCHGCHKEFCQDCRKTGRCGSCHENLCEECVEGHMTEHMEHMADHMQAHIEFNMPLHMPCPIQ